MFAHQVPLLLSIAFLIGISIAVLMIANLLIETSQKRKRKIVVAFYVVYLSVVTFATFNNVFTEVMLPPRIVLLTTIPLLTFYLLAVSKWNGYKKFLTDVKLSKLIAVHKFRLIGSTFLFLYFFNELPKPFAFISGFGDVITAVTSFWVVRSIKNNKINSRRIVLVWNTFGLIDIIVTSVMALIYTKFTIDFGTPGVEILTYFPYCFIPAFAPATIVFLHISIYRKLSIS